MRFVDERTFHLTMGGIYVTALLLENAAARYLPTWDPPTIGSAVSSVRMRELIGDAAHQQTFFFSTVRDHLTSVRATAPDSIRRK